MALKIFRLPNSGTAKTASVCGAPEKRKSARTISFATQLSPLCLAPM